jgi:hypothetical protein
MTRVFLFLSRRPRTATAHTSKESVREYMELRNLSSEPAPTPDEIRGELDRDLAPDNKRLDGQKDLWRWPTNLALLAPCLPPAGGHRIVMVESPVPSPHLRNDLGAWGSVAPWARRAIFFH